MTTNYQNQIVLADNFPAKAYLLVAHLSENDPGVSSFSSDGSSFEIYDQSVFAQKYLPRYFKHSNYGSFVRQLNLYGFASSRLKQNNDVVVWTHECFRRDHKELVKEIKRAKKAKSAKPKPSQVVHVDNNNNENNNNNIRSPSPPSLSDDSGYASKSPSSSIKAAMSNSNNSAGGTGGGVVDRNWLESEFSYLKRQNEFLERKLDARDKFIEQRLDALLQIALRSPSSSSSSEHRPRRFAPDDDDGGRARARAVRHHRGEEARHRDGRNTAQGGEKRRRLSPVESGELPPPPQRDRDNVGAPHAPRRLLSVAEEQKLFDDGDDNDGGDNCGYYGIYGEQRLFYDENYGMMEPAPYPPPRRQRGDDGNGDGDDGNAPRSNYVAPAQSIEPAPYPPYRGDYGGRAPPANDVAHRDARAPAATAAGAQQQAPPPREDSLKRFVDIMLSDEEQAECKQASPPPPERRPSDYGTTALDDALMEEAMNAILPGDDDDDPPSNAAGAAGAPTYYFAENRNEAKPGGVIEEASYGVDVVHVVPPADEGPPARSGATGDLEEGGMLPIGVAVVSATAELVPAEGNLNNGDGDDDDGGAASLRVSLRNERRDRRRVTYLLAFIGIVLSAGVVGVAVAVTKNNRSKVASVGRIKGGDDSSGSRDIIVLGHKPKPCADGHRKDRHGKCILLSGKVINEEDYNGSLFDRDDGADSASSGWKTGEGDEEGDEDDDDYEDAENEAGESGNDPLDSFKEIPKERLWANREWRSSNRSNRKKRIGSLFDDFRDGNLPEFSVKLAGADYFCKPHR